MDWYVYFLLHCNFVSVHTPKQKSCAYFYHLTGLIECMSLNSDFILGRNNIASRCRVIGTPIYRRFQQFAINIGTTILNGVGYYGELYWTNKQKTVYGWVSGNHDTCGMYLYSHFRDLNLVVWCCDNIKLLINRTVENTLLVNKT